MSGLLSNSIRPLLYEGGCGIFANRCIRITLSKGDVVSFLNTLVGELGRNGAAHRYLATKPIKSRGFICEGKWDQRGRSYRSTNLHFKPAYRWPVQNVDHSSEIDVSLVIESGSRCLGGINPRVLSRNHRRRGCLKPIVVGQCEPPHDGQCNVFFLYFERFSSLAVHDRNRDQRGSECEISTESRDPFTKADFIRHAERSASCVEKRSVPDCYSDETDHERLPNLVDFWDFQDHECQPDAVVSGLIGGNCVIWQAGEA